MFDKYRVPQGESLDLARFDPADTFLCGSDEDDDKARLDTLGKRLEDLQTRLYAQRTHKVLLVLQGMDTSGKDGTIRGVFRRVDPLGLRVAAFKSPTPDELAHDFLWRVHAQVPRAGELAIFNRSHYEDVLITRVHDWIDKDECQRRYAHINAFERLLSDTGTTVVKCFLYISKGEQRKRLQARIDNPHKHWKFDLQDIKERKHWRAYQAAYEDALAATSTSWAPWTIVPADSKRHRNLMVAQLLVDTLEGLGLKYPPAKPELAGVKIK